MTAKRQKAYHWGIEAEKFAAWFLRMKGYHIIAERYRNSQGEIDILARKGNLVAAVEVKARKSFEECAETVTPFKQQKIARAVELAIAELAELQGHDIRFDVIWIAPRKWPHHIEDAWRMS